MRVASFALTLAAALVGATLASLLRIPAAPLLGSMAAVATVNLSSSWCFQLPSQGRWVIYCAVGWLLGQTVTSEALASMRTAFVPIIVVVLAFLVFGLVLAWLLWRFTDFDVNTALLATAPGGIAQMGVLSAEAKANVPIVLTIHVLRITSVIVLMSVGLKLMGGRS